MRLDRAIRDGRGVSTETRSIVRASRVANQVRGRGAFLFRGSLFVWWDCCFSVPFPKIGLHVFVLHILQTEPHASDPKAFLLTQSAFPNLFAREGSGGSPLDAAHVIRESHAHLQAAIEAAQVRYSIITSLPLASRRSSHPQPKAGVRWIRPPVTTW